LGGNLGDASRERLAESCIALDFRRRVFFIAPAIRRSVFAILCGRIKALPHRTKHEREALLT